MALMEQGKTSTLPVMEFRTADPARQDQPRRLTDLAEAGAVSTEEGVVDTRRNVTSAEPGPR